MNRIDRIRYYEGILNDAALVLKNFETSLDAYAAIRSRLSELEKYYTSPEWKADFEASERGELPADLHCGVLSEDGIDHVLDDNAELLARCRRELDQEGRS